MWAAKKNSLKLGEGLASVHQLIKDLMFGKWITTFKVLNPNILLELCEDERVAWKRMASYWKKDPVHMTEEGYEVMAKALAIEMLDISYTREKTQSSSSNNEQVQRQSWVEEEEAIAYRKYGSRGRHGSGGYHGHFRGNQRGHREDGGASKAEANMEGGITSPTSCPILYR
jgi:hypothetical protein